MNPQREGRRAGHFYDLASDGVTSAILCWSRQSHRFAQVQKGGEVGRFWESMWDERYCCTTFEKHNLPQVMPIQVTGIQDQVMGGDLRRQPMKLSSLGWDSVSELQLLKGAADKSEGRPGSLLAGGMTQWLRVEILKPDCLCLNPAFVN